MSCPRCGDDCRCESPSRVRSRFQLDGAEHGRVTALIDPEAYDASEERFSASLEESSPARQRFVIETEETGADTVPPPAVESANLSQPAAEESVATSQLATSPVEWEAPEPDGACESSPDGSSPSLPLDAAGESWKDEVAARLNSYRARRKPRPPRYPSLRLKFDAPESRTSSRTAEAALSVPLQDNLAPAEPEFVDRAPLENVPPDPRPVPPPETGRIIEFPRFLYQPPAPTYELAEPVPEAPRILDVPETAPPPPALGGISLPAEEKEPEKRPGFDIPLQSAPMSQRIFALVIDSLIIAVAFAMFGYIVFRIAGGLSFSLSALETAVLVGATFWAGYQYLLIIYTGTTPGLRVAHLRLSHFDGSPVPRRMRRWRVLASVLSAVSLGLGFAWSYLDEDALCWHDRITRTYLAPER